MVDLPSPWVQGDARQLEIVKTRVQNDEARPSLTVSVEVTVDEELDTGWIMNWASDLNAIGSVGLPIDALTGDERALFESLLLPVRYRIDETSIVEEVLNLDELQSALDTLWSLLLGQLEGADAEAVEQVLTVLGEDLLYSTYLEDIDRFHAFHSLFLGVDEVGSLAVDIPSPFGPMPLRSTLEIRVLDVVDADGCVSVEQAITPESESLETMMRALLDEFGIPISPEDTAELESAMENLSILVTLVGQVDWETGHLWRVTTTETVSLGPETRVDTVVITDVTPG